MSGSRPELSIVLLAHRRDSYLDQALSSLAAQSFKNFETVVVVNGPEGDSIAQALSDRKDLETIVVRAEGSLSTLSNIGMGRARGEYVGRFDSDDISAPDRFQKQIEYLRDHPDIDVLGGQVELMDETGRRSGRLSRPLEDNEIRGQMPFRCPMLHPTVLIKRSVFEKVGGYRQNSHAEDWDLWIRIAELPGCRFANLKDDLVFYRQHGLQTSSQRSRQFRGEIEVLKQALKRNFRWRYLLGLSIRVLMSVIPSSVLQSIRSAVGGYQKRRVHGVAP